MLTCRLCCLRARLRSLKPQIPRELRHGVERVQGCAGRAGLLGATKRKAIDADARVGPAHPTQLPALRSWYMSS